MHACTSKSYDPLLLLEQKFAWYVVIYITYYKYEKNSKLVFLNVNETFLVYLNIIAL